MRKLEKMAAEMLGEIPGREVNVSRMVDQRPPLAPPEVRYSFDVIANALGMALEDRPEPDAATAIGALEADSDTIAGEA